MNRTKVRTRTADTLLTRLTVEIRMMKETFLRRRLNLTTTARGTAVVHKVVDKVVDKTEATNVDAMQTWTTRLVTE